MTKLPKFKNGEKVAVRTSYGTTSRFVVVKSSTAKLTLRGMVDRKEVEIAAGDASITSIKRVR